MRLIDADALLEKLIKTPRYFDLKFDIDNAPTIEAEPVKHGEWKYYNYTDLNNPYCGYYECTVCKQHEHTKHKYCPNCGAKMDG